MNRKQRRSLRHTIAEFEREIDRQGRLVRIAQFDYDNLLADKAAQARALAVIKVAKERIGGLVAHIDALRRIAKGPKMYPAVRKTDTPRTYARA